MRFPQTHSIAVSMEESRRNDERRAMAAQRALREAAQAAGIQKPEPTGPVRVASGGGEHGELSVRHQAVLDFMSDGAEHTVEEGSAQCGIRQTSFSALLRDLRKEKHGAHTLLLRRDGHFSYYRLVAQ